MAKPQPTAFKVSRLGRPYFYDGKHGTRVATGATVFEYRSEVDAAGAEYRVWALGDGSQVEEA